MINSKGNCGAFSHERFSIHPAIKMGYVSLNVSDLNKSLDFYESVLEFETAHRISDDAVLLTASDEHSSHLIELHQVKTNEAGDYAERGLAQLGSGTRRRTRAGLYHFAILLPERISC